MDGKIIIGTTIDTSGLDDGIDKVKSRIKQLQDKYDAEIDTNIDYYEMENSFDALDKAFEGFEKGSKEYKQIEDYILENLKGSVEWQSLLLTGIRDLKKEYDELSHKQIMSPVEIEHAKELKQLIEDMINIYEKEMGEGISVKGFTDTDKTLPKINNKLKTMGKSLEKIGRQVGHMGLSLLGIHSIYGMISSSVSRITSQNQEMKAGIDQLNNMLDNIIYRILNFLLPVIEAIVYMIGRLFKDVLGIDLNSQNFSNNMKNANNSATKLRKQLMGFDEMNILNKDGTIGALGESAGGDNNNDTTTPGGVTQKAKDIIKQYERTWDYIEDKTFEFLDEAMGWGANNIGVTEPTSAKYLMKKYGDMIDEVADFVEKGQKRVANGIVYLTDEYGRTIELTEPYYNSLKELLDTRLWSKNVGGPIREFVKQYKKLPPVEKDVKAINSATKSFATETQQEWNKAFDNMKSALNGAVYEYKNGQYEVRLATGQTKTFTEQQFKWLQEYAKQNNIKLIDGANVVSSTIQTGIRAIGFKSQETGNDIQNGATGVATGVIGTANRAFNNIEQKGEESANNVIDSFEKVQPAIKKAFDWDWYYPELQQGGAGLGGAVSGAMIGAINKGLDSTETVINKAISIIRQFIQNMNLPGAVGVATLGASVASLRSITLPRIKLAKGGIINKVGSGVPVGAIAGERGREAILPLTDSQQMEYLGRAIAKYIVINLTNVTELDGRQIARSVSQVMNDMNFASNGGVI